MVNIESDGKNGLYTPQYESDACGTGLYVNLDNKASNSIVDKALNMLERMEHRGACGCEPESGDGAGISLHLPHVFYKKQSVEGNLGFFLPDKGSYGTGLFFLPKNRLVQDSIKIEFQQAADQLGFQNKPPSEIVLS